MLDIEESQQLMEKYIDLRGKAKESTEMKALFKQHEKLCIEKFKYLVTMRTGRYKNYSNYEDLNQEGFEALVKAMTNYDPNKGIFFWWAHKYIDTRIARSANLYTTIRYPLRYAKEVTPHKESVFPTIIEKRFCPDTQVESAQVGKVVQDSLKYLTDEQRDIVILAFGLDGDKPHSINKICKKLNISRINCVKIMDRALSTIKSNIKI